MYKAFYFKPKISDYENFISSFMDNFELKRVMKEKKVYILESEQMIATVKPEMVEVLVYDYSDRKFVKSLRDFLN